MNWRPPILPKLDDLKKQATLIHYFGLGFIQIKIDMGKRYHFYTPFLPAIKEGVHNHRYGFQSRILSGSLKNFIYVPEEGQTHVRYSVSCKPDNKLHPVFSHCHLGSPVIINHYDRGSTYSMPYKTFHRVESPVGCITEVSLGVVMQDHAEVIDQTDCPRKCPFENPGKPGDLWDRVDQMLREAVS